MKLTFQSHIRLWNSFPPTHTSILLVCLLRGRRRWTGVGMQPSLENENGRSPLLACKVTDCDETLRRAAVRIGRSFNKLKPSALTELHTTRLQIL